MKSTVIILLALVASAIVVSGDVSNEIPSQVLIQEGTGFFCSGSLISPNSVLTAATCAERSRDPMIILGTRVINGVVIPEKIVVASNITIHPDFNPQTGRYNIALIKLSTNVTDIKPIKLPRGNSNTYTGRTAKAIVLVLAHGSIYPQINVVQSRVLTNIGCQIQLGQGTQIFRSNICLSASQGKGLCSDDTGGSLVANSTLIGVGLINGPCGCGTSYPAGFTRISSYLNWIERNAGI